MHGRTGHADAGFADPALLRHDIRYMSAAVEHGINKIKRRWKIVDTGLVRRKNLSEAKLLWACGCAYHNRALRLYGPERLLR